MKVNNGVNAVPVSLKIKSIIYIVVKFLAFIGCCLGVIYVAYLVYNHIMPGLVGDGTSAQQITAGLTATAILIIIAYFVIFILLRRIDATISSYLAKRFPFADTERIWGVSVLEETLRKENNKEQ